MKKIILFTLALFTVFSFSLTAVVAEEAVTAEIFVNLSNKGELVAAYEKITVTDIDGDNALTVNDALYAAHEALYDGGAESGYASAESDYGLSITKLWGDTSGSYGYYVNNASAWSLADPIKEGDVVSAFVYSDGTGWSDSYSFFNVNTATVEAGGELELTLSMAGYDAEWNPVTLPVENAVITLNGEKTEFSTDADGKVTVSVEEAGVYVISAESETAVIVPPVCVITVNAVENSEAESEIVDESANIDEHPKPGDESNVLIFAIIAIAAVSAAMLLGKRINER